MDIMSSSGVKSFSARNLIPAQLSVLKKFSNLMDYVGTGILLYHKFQLKRKINFMNFVHKFLVLPLQLTDLEYILAIGSTVTGISTNFRTGRNIMIK
jgi:hypothetical protein